MMLLVWEMDDVGMRDDVAGARDDVAVRDMMLLVRG